MRTKYKEKPLWYHHINLFDFVLWNFKSVFSKHVSYKTIFVIHFTKFDSKGIHLEQV